MSNLVYEITSLLNGMAVTNPYGTYNTLNTYQPAFQQSVFNADPRLQNFYNRIILFIIFFLFPNYKSIHKYNL